MRPRYAAVALGVLLALAATARGGGAEPAPPISLSGSWRFELDRGDEGLVGSWGEGRRLGGAIMLPGALQAQGFGDEITVDTPWTGQIVDRSFFTQPRYAPYRLPGRVKVPFWLQPDRHYAGPAWYQRDVTIPDEWRGRRAVLHLERPHWQTIAWLDGRILGSNDSLSTPHEYDLGPGLAAGPHVLTIRVDNRLVVDVGINSHSVTDHTQGNWNGIVGALELRPTGEPWIEDLQVYPDLAARSAIVRGTVASRPGAPIAARLRLAAAPLARATTSGATTPGATTSGATTPGATTPGATTPGATTPGATTPGAAATAEVVLEPGAKAFEAHLELGASASAWDEFTPALFRLTATLDAVGSRDEREVVFGLREIATRGTQLTINGRPAFVRGTLECAIFPKTGHPPTDVESWKRVVGIAKAHGLNTIRFHSWCPPEAAFAAADELGFYYQVEVASWANSSTRLGVGLPVDEWLYRETERILKAYGNHPSFLLLPYGNEPGGNDREYLGRWVERFRRKDPRRLYTSASGWPQIAQNQFHVTPDPRIQGWGQGLASRVNARPPETRSDYRDYVQAHAVPVISHEIGQWCAFPNLSERAKYTGYLKAKNFDIFADTLAAHGMADQAEAFLRASGKLQTQLYKEDIESALRTAGMGGFELLDLHDFPGQGTALVGVLDAFWDSKGYVSPEEYRRFCNATVPLARLERRVFTTDDVLSADVELAHFGPAPLAGARASWRLVDDAGHVSARGTWPARDVPVGNGFALGRVSLPLRGLRAPARYRLVVGLAGTPFENDWDVWVYPQHLDPSLPAGVRIVRELDGASEAWLREGGRLLLAIPPGHVRGDELGKVELGFSTIFWNTAWTGRQPPHTLGILCDPAHPALAGFPTEGYSNWQWWYVVSRAGAMILDGLPRALRPTVQLIDDWVTSRRLGLLFEGRVGKGSLLVTSVELDRDLEANPVVRQLRHSLLRYAGGERFAPRVELRPDDVRALMR